MFVVMKLQDFDIEAVNFPLLVKVDSGKMIGYLPVYATREDALSEYEGSELVEIREKELR